MSTPAVVTMILALLLVWGGLAAAITLAVVRTRQQRVASAQRDIPDD
jgi:hypothetical protein